MNPKMKTALKRIALGGVIFATIATAGTVVVHKAIDTLAGGTYVDTKKSEELDEYAKDLESTFHQAEVWGDEEFQDVIHKMTHQKVESTQKWGAIQMTSKRIEILSALLDQRRNYLQHYEVYRQILDEWEINNFQNVDDHHNIIWELQGGSVGKATGVFSAERERKYIENVFGK